MAISLLVAKKLGNMMAEDTAVCLAEPAPPAEPTNSGSLAGGGTSV